MLEERGSGEDRGVSNLERIGWTIVSSVTPLLTLLFSTAATPLKKLLIAWKPIFGLGGICNLLRLAILMSEAFNQYRVDNDAFDVEHAFILPSARQSPTLTGFELLCEKKLPE